MGMLLRVVVLLRALLFCNAFLDLTGLSEVSGVWRATATVPCTYKHMEGFAQQTLLWTVVDNQISGTVFRRDSSGDHVFLAKYRDRVGVLSDAPGNVSLHILDLEFSDRGTYTCQVTWRASNSSLVVREIATKLEVVKVAATKPIIRAGELGLVVPAGASTSLTCVASGSPPISYRWFRSVPARKALLLSSQAELAWDHLQPSDSGKYYCEAENRAGAGAVQMSDEVELVVRDLPMTTAAPVRDVEASGTHQASTALPLTEVTPESTAGYPEKNYTTQNRQGTHLSLYQVILLAVAGGAVVFLVTSLIICLRKPKESQVYEVTFHNSRAPAPSESEIMGHYEEPITSTENNYAVEPMEKKRSEEKRSNDYECVGSTPESQYEVGNAG